MNNEITGANGLSTSFFNKVGSLLDNARKNVKTAVNLTMVYTYYEIGRMIVEEEQNGADRAEYGKRVLSELSEYLTQNYGKDFLSATLKT